MNLLFFNRSFYPDTEATGQYLTELCEDLAVSGHNVTVVCGKSYHTAKSKQRFLIERESYKSIKILRAAGTIFPKKKIFFRLINLGTYFLNAFFAGFLTKDKPDIVIALTDPPLLGLHGIFFSFWYRAKFIYYCKDIYPDVGMITGKLRHPVYTFILQIANMFSFKLADKVICIGEDMKRKIEEKNIDSGKIQIVHDWADTKELFPVPSSTNPFLEKYDLKNKFTVIYSGNIGLTQGLDKIIKVAEYFKDKKDLRFLLIGEGANKENLQKSVIDKKLQNIAFFPYQSKDELRYSLSAANIHLISVVKGLAGVMVPSKIYGVLACSKPFIAWVDKDSEISTIATKFNCGIIVSPGDIKGMISSIEWALQNEEKLNEMGNNGRKAVLSFFNRNVSTERFNKILVSGLHEID